MPDSRHILTVDIYNSKTVLTHFIFVTSVCVMFGVINLLTGAAAAGIIVLVTGIAVPIVFFVLRKRVDLMVQGLFLSMVQLLSIIVIGAAKHDLHTMYALMLASMVITAVYCNVRSLVVHWIIMDAASFIGIIARDFFYGEETMVTIFKGIVSMNVGAVVLVYLVKAYIKFMDKIQSAQHESEGLVDEVNAKMEVVNRLMENQNSVVSSVSGITVNLKDSVAGLKDVSIAMGSSAEEQERTIMEITDAIASFGAVTDKSLEAASKARTAADKSTHMLTENNSEVDKMLAAMDEINNSSVQIGTIIKTIEDIAFQTNILALNASIEAARAGTMGKGFAVVADEVRSLATKSDEAAKSTSVLINSSIKSVESGSKIAQSVAEKMREAINVSRQSAEFSVMIEELTANQNASMESMRVKMEQMSESVAKGLDISVKNTEIAQAVADEVQRLNEIVAVD